MMPVSARLTSIVGGLDQLQQDVLDILADVAGLGERGGVGDRERHVEHLGERLRQIGLAAAGRAEQQDVRLGQLDRLGAAGILAITGLNPLVVVVDSDRQRTFGGVLADHIVLEEVPDLRGFGQLIELHIAGLGQLFLDDLVAEVDAFVADVHAGAGDELLHLLLALAAERALEQVTTVTDTSHVPCYLLPSTRSHIAGPLSKTVPVSRPKFDR
jgi:hypothetical protein